MTAWTPDEDARLLSAYQELKKGRQHDPVQWAEIAALVGGDRSQKACRNRYNRLVAVPAAEEKPVEKPVEKPATKQKEQEPPPAEDEDEDEDEEHLLTHGAWERPKGSGGRISGPLAALAPDARVRLVWQAWQDEKLVSRPSYAKMMKAVWWCDEDGTTHSKCARGTVACRMSRVAPRPLPAPHAHPPTPPPPLAPYPQRAAHCS